MSGGSPLTLEGQRLLDFARPSQVETGGFAWLDDRGRPTPGASMPSWITSRMTYVFSLASQLDVPWAAASAEHGVRALREDHHDGTYGGWYEALLPGGEAPADTTKGAYAHAFVALAAATATAAGTPERESS